MSAADDFFGQIDPDMKPLLKIYGERLTQSSQSDEVLLIMARKAVCLADCLSKLGYAHFDGVVTSDRILDMNMDWLKGRKIHIFDDAVISGTTLYRTIERLRKFGVEKDQIRITALCADEEWWCPDLVRPEEPIMMLDDNQTSAFCAQIVRAIGMMPRPYSVDYPIFENIVVARRDLELITSIPGFASDNLTSPLQHSRGLLSLTLTPARWVQEEVKKSLGWNIAGEHLLKLRVYGRPMEGSQQAYSLTLLPVASCPPLSQDALRTLLDSIIACFPKKREDLTHWFITEDPDGSSKAQMRLVLYIMATRMARLWLEQLQQIVFMTTRPMEALQNRAYLFPPPISDLVYALSRSNLPLFVHADRAPVPGTESKVEPARADVAGPLFPPPFRHEALDNWSIHARVTEPFLHLYNTKELPARRLVKKFGPAVFEMPEHQSVMCRLDGGYSLEDMLAWLEHVPKSMNRQLILSLALDGAIDRGVAVPTTCVRNGMVYRAYRHGEDVAYGETEIRLSAKMLYNLQQSGQVASLPRMWVEKALVMFIRAGIQQKFLSPPGRSVGEYERTMGIRYSLHGAVVAVESPKLYVFPRSNGLTDVLAEDNYLEEVRIHKKSGRDAQDRSITEWKVSKEPVTGYSKEQGTKAEKLGIVLGRLLEARPPHGKPSVSTRDLALMASCVYPRDMIGALAAEISIIRRHWQKVRVDYGDAMERAATHPSVNWERLAEQLRINTARTALKSGLWKYAEYERGTPWKLIAEIEGVFPDRLYSAEWRSYWPQAEEKSSQASERRVAALIGYESSLLHQAAIMWTLLILACHLMIDAAPDHQPFFASISRHLQRLLRLARGIHAAMPPDMILDPDMPARPNANKQVGHLLDQVELKLREQTLIPAKFYSYIYENMNHCVGRMGSVLEEVDAIADTWAEPTRVNHVFDALMLQIKPRAGQEPTVKRAFERLKNQMTQLRGGSVSLHSITPPDEFPDDVLWLRATGHHAAEHLIQLATKTLQQLSEIADIKVILYTQLPFEFKLVGSATSNRYYGAHFWRRARAVWDELKLDQTNWSVASITEAGDSALRNSLTQQIHKTADALFASQVARETIHVAGDFPQHIVATLHTLRPRRRTPQRPTSAKADVGVIVVVADEVWGWRGEMQQHGAFRSRQHNKSVRQSYVGELAGKDGAVHRIVCTQQLTKGQRSVMSTYHAMITEWHPKLMVLLGIGGGIQDKVRYGDVVVPEAVFDYDKGAATHEGKQTQVEPYRVESWVRNWLQDYRRERGMELAHEGDELVLPAAGGAPFPTFKVFLDAALGTGSLTLKELENETRDLLLNTNRTTAVVETESGGFMHDFWEGQLSREEKAMGALVVRGISDYANPDKSDQWREKACANATRFLIDLLQNTGPLDTYIP